MCGGQIGSDIAGSSVKAYEVFDAEASASLRTVYCLDRQGPIHIDTGLTSGCDSLDSKVLPLGLAKTTDKDGSHVLGVVALGRRAGRGLDSRIDNISLRLWVLQQLWPSELLANNKSPTPRAGR